MFDHGAAAQRFVPEVVGAFFVEVARRHVQRQRHVASRLAARELYRFDSVLEHRFGAGEGRGEPALIGGERPRTVFL